MFVLDLEPGDRTCELAPPGVGPQAHLLAITAGGYGKSTSLVLESPGRAVLARGQERGSDGRVVFELPDGETASQQSLCFRNKGVAKVALAGERAAGSDVGPGGRDHNARVSIYALDPDPAPWLSEAPDAIRAVGLARGAAAGSPTGWLVIGLAVGAAVLAVGAVCRQALDGGQR